MNTVLVYGTLRPGLNRTVKVPGKMFSLGGFPGVRLDESSAFTFTAEIIEVDDDTLAGLDCYEGYYEDDHTHSLYIRRRYTDLDAGVDGWIYEYNHDTGGLPTVESGDWLEHTGQSSGTASRYVA